jgi:hypothetical protein
MPVGWVANRNTLLATVATMGSLLLLVRVRSAWRLPGSLLLAALAVGCKESGVVAFILVASWLVLEAKAHRDRGEGATARRALGGAAIALAVAVVYVAGLAVSGAGTRSLFYATPWREPFAYLANLWVLFTAGLLRLLAPVSIDLRMIAPAAGRVASVAGALLAWPLALLIGRRLGARPAPMFLGLWLLWSLLAEGAAPPSDRLLLQAAFGSAGLLGLLLHQALGRAPAGDGEHLWSRSRLWRSLAWAIAISAGLLSFVGSVIQTATLAGLSRELRRQVLAVETGPPIGQEAGSGMIDAVVLQAGSAMLPFVLTPTWWAESGRDDVRFTIFMMSRRGLEWMRESDRTCIIRSTGTPFLSSIFETVYRSDAEPPRPGEVLSTTLFDVEPHEIDATGLRAVRLRFHRSLDSPGLHFLVPDSRGSLSPSPVPPVGATIVLPEPAPTVAWSP